VSAQSTPVTADATATAAELQARTQQDYAIAEARRQQQAAEDRINGQQNGGNQR